MALEKTFSPWCIHPGELPATPLFLDQGLDKLASSLDDCPSIQNFIHRAKPEKGHYTLLLHAVGADEVWGANRKADAFPLQHLVPHKDAQFGYKTFEKRAQGYVHHRNDPARWTGKVLLAEYNEPMGRVELIAKYSKQRLLEEDAPHFVETIESGQLPAVSMGVRVPYDVCSLSTCMNKAATTADYCEHIQDDKLAIYPDGTRIRMLNVFPIFHDISLVNSPADRAARALLKVADDTEKSGDIDKRIPVKPLAGLRRLGKQEYEVLLSTSQDPDIPLPTLRKLAAKPVQAAGLASMGILLRPHEYAAMFLTRKGRAQEASRVYSKRAAFEVFNSDVGGIFQEPDAEILAEFLPFVHSRSVYMPAFLPRVNTKVKVGEYLNIPRSASAELIDDDELVREYALYRKTAEDHLLSGRASQSALGNYDILTAVFGSGIPVFMQRLPLDRPSALFASAVRGSYLPDATVTTGGY